MLVMKEIFAIFKSLLTNHHYCVIFILFFYRSGGFSPACRVSFLSSGWLNDPLGNMCLNSDITCSPSEVNAAEVHMDRHSCQISGCAWKLTFWIGGSLNSQTPMIGKLSIILSPVRVGSCIVTAIPKSPKSVCLVNELVYLTVV